MSSDEFATPIEFMRIYDRWGNLIFEKSKPEINNPADGWGGRSDSGAILSGVYTYYIKFEQEVDGSNFLVGTLTLLE